jgi:hypothetical protein
MHLHGRPVVGVQALVKTLCYRVLSQNVHLVKGTSVVMQRRLLTAASSPCCALLTFLVVASSGISAAQWEGGRGDSRAVKLPAWHPARFRMAPADLLREEEEANAGQRSAEVGTEARPVAETRADAPAHVATGQTTTTDVDARPQEAPVRDQGPPAGKPCSILQRTRGRHTARMPACARRARLVVYF